MTQLIGFIECSSGSIVVFVDGTDNADLGPISEQIWHGASALNVVGSHQKIQSQILTHPAARPGG